MIEKGFQHLRVHGEFLQVVVLIDGVMHAQVEQLLQRLVNEDDADQRGESLLGEACDVTNQRAGVCGHQQQAEEGRPQADAGPQGEVGEAVLPETRMSEGSGHEMWHPQSSGKHKLSPLKYSWNKFVQKETYLQNLKRIFSKTRTGPVLPRMVRG